MKNRKRNHKFLIFMLSVILIIGIGIYNLEKKTMPIAIDISRQYATSSINKEINNAVTQTIDEKNIKSGDFFKNTLNQNEQLNYLEVDTILINNVCGRVAERISENLNELKNEKISLPIGLLSGIGLFYTEGPEMKIELRPVGSAKVDYETEFKSVGINQMNFLIWINIESEVKIISPIHTDSIILKRKLMLVNTIYNGEVPDDYINLK